MKKKSIIILASVVVVCALGLLLSHVFDWPVDSSNASGNISKSSRFSRKTAEGGVSNMQELLQNDAAYKNSIVASYYVMQTRAQQFGALVDMSNQVAGGIKDFEGVLKDMNETRPMIDNVCASMAEAGKNLNTALGGEPCDDLAESVTNSALAYTTLQKQNKLADKFIDVADKYLAKNGGSDKLKLVRDQWMDYQQMTAVLDKDEKAAADLEKKGHKLSSDQTASALMSFDEVVRESVVGFADLCRCMDIDSPIADVITVDGIGMLISDATRDAVSDATRDAVSDATRDAVSDATRDAVSDATRDAVSDATRDIVSDATRDIVSDATRDIVSDATRDIVSDATRDAVSIVMMGFNDLDVLKQAVNDVVSFKVFGEVPDMIGMLGTVGFNNFLNNEEVVLGNGPKNDK
jgi:hypothetical protein